MRTADLTGVVRAGGAVVGLVLRGVPSVDLGPSKVPKFPLLRNTSAAAASASSPAMRGHLGRHLGRLLRLGSSSPLLCRLATALVGGGFAPLGGVGAVLGVNPRVERLRPRVRGGLLLLGRGERGGSLGRREGERGRSRERRRGRRALGPGSAPSLGIRSAPPVAPVAGCLRGGRREVRRVQRRAARDGVDAVGGELTGTPRDARVSLEPGPFAAKLLDAIRVAKGVERVLARAGGWGDVGDHHRARVPQERVPEHLREFTPAERHVVRAHVQRADALLERQERLVDLGTLESGLAIVLAVRAGRCRRGR